MVSGLRFWGSLGCGKMERRKEAYWQAVDSGSKINYHSPSNYVAWITTLPAEFLSNTGDEKGCGSRSWGLASNFHLRQMIKLPFVLFWLLFFIFMFLKELLSSRVLSPSSSSDHLHSCHLHIKVSGAFLLDMIYNRWNTGHNLFTQFTYLYCLLHARPPLKYLHFANGCDQRWMLAGVKASTSHMTPRSWELISAPIYRYLNGVRKFKQIFPQPRD